MHVAHHGMSVRETSRVVGRLAILKYNLANSRSRQGWGMPEDSKPEDHEVRLVISRHSLTRKRIVA